MNLKKIQETINNTTIGGNNKKGLYFGNDYISPCVTPLPDNYFETYRRPKSICYQFTNLISLEIFFKYNKNLYKEIYKTHKNIFSTDDSLYEILNLIDNTLNILKKYRKKYEDFINNNFNATKKTFIRYICNDICENTKNLIKSDNQKSKKFYYDQNDLRYSSQLESVFCQKSFLILIRGLTNDYEISDSNKVYCKKLLIKLINYMKKYAADIYNLEINFILMTNKNVLTKNLKNNGYKGSFMNPLHYMCLEYFELKMFDEIIKGKNKKEVCDKYGIPSKKYTYGIIYNISNYITNKINNNEITIKDLKKKCKLDNDKINRIFLNFI